MKAAVIGAGVGGMAIAIRLAKKGYEVSVYEQNDHSGGKISEISSHGFRFDTGPSLFTLPELSEELFELAGENMDDHIPYTRLDVICKYFYEDGTNLKAYGDPVKFAREVEDQTAEPAKNVLNHLDKSKQQYELTADIFLLNSLHKLGNFFKTRVLKGIIHFYRVDVFTSMHKRNAGRFKDKRVVQLFDRYATYNGSNPFIAPATLNVISHLEHNMGAFFPARGMRSLAVGMEALAKRNGVSFKFSKKVDRVITEKNKARALLIQKKEHPFDLIVSDVDIHYFYNNLLPDKKAEKSSDKQLSSSALIFYWGIRTTSASLDLHNILFTEDYEAEFHELFKNQSIYKDPTVYIYISSKLTPADAPKNKENWFVMINVPPDTGQDWDQLIAEARYNIISKINRMLNTSLEDLIEFEQIGSPLTIEENTKSWKGALYGNNSNSMNSAFRRHSFRHPSINNLYFVGGSVHPGGGIPLCLASAKIADNEIKPV